MNGGPFIFRLRGEYPDLRTPEDAFIAAEEGEREDADERPLSERLGMPEERFTQLLDLMPPDEADCLELAMRGCLQRDIGVIFGDLTQSAISYRWQRSLRRLRWLHEWGDRFSPDDLRRDLYEPLRAWHSECRWDHAPAEERARDDVEICAAYWETSSQTLTAERLGATQGRISHRLRTVVWGERGKGPSILDRLVESGATHLAVYRDGIKSMHEWGASVRSHIRAGRWR